MSPNTRTLATGGAVALAVLAAFVAWFLLRSAPAEVSIDDAVAGAQGSPPPDAPSPTSTSVSEDLDGGWAVAGDGPAFDFDTSAGTFLGFRIDEQLSSVGATTAVGRTPAVEADVLVDGTTLTAATITADLSALTTDDSRRDRKARSAIGDTATFELDAPVELVQPEVVGETVEVAATGTFTLNGVAREVTVPLTFAYAQPDLLVVTTSFEVVLADHQIQKPSAPIVLDIADVGTAEVQLYLSPAA